MGSIMKAGRTIVAGLAATALTSLIMVGAARAQAGEPIRIGMIYSKQGPGTSIGEFLQRGQQQWFFQHPRDGSVRLSDDPQTGIGRDSEVGVSQYQGQPVGLTHGQVDQAGSAAVTSRP